MRLDIPQVFTKQSALLRLGSERILGLPLYTLRFRVSTASITAS